MKNLDKKIDTIVTVKSDGSVVVTQQDTIYYRSYDAAAIVGQLWSNRKRQ